MDRSQNLAALETVLDALSMRPRPRVWSNCVALPICPRSSKPCSVSRWPGSRHRNHLLMTRTPASVSDHVFRRQNWRLWSCPGRTGASVVRRARRCLALNACSATSACIADGLMSDRCLEDLFEYCAQQCAQKVSRSSRVRNVIAAFETQIWVSLWQKGIDEQSDVL